MRHDDAHIWKAYTQNINPFRRAKGRSLPDASSPRTSSPLEIRYPHPIEKVRGTPHTIETPRSQEPLRFLEPIDRHIERRLRAGDFTPEARVDLHGMTQVRAREALNRFLDDQLRMGRRNLLVITGKGREGTGVLRIELPNWLDASPFAARILALRQASARHGGGGAFYVILRRTAGT